MTIKQAINKALDNGYSLSGVKKQDVVLNIHDVVLDPKFWQALGKAEGWCRKIRFERAGGIMMDITTDCWDTKMRKMTEALIDGKNLEEFFEEL